MVGGSVDGGESVGTGRETVGDVDGQDTVRRRSVQTLKEGELLGVRRGSLCHGVKEVDDNVRVALNVARGVHLLRRSEVVLVRVDEETCFEVLNRHLDGEWLVFSENGAVGGNDELRRRHVGLCSDDAHRCGVARAANDLLAIGDVKTSSSAEVDEVVR